MESWSKIFSSSFLILSRRNIYKYIIGEIDLTPDELDKIQEYLEEIRPLQFSEHKPNLIRQIEQRKIPYLRDLSVDELDCLLASNIDLNGLLAVIYAKGGMLSNFETIYWDKNNKKYKKTKTIALFSFILLIIIMLNISIWIILAVICKAFPEIETIRVITSGFAILAPFLSFILMVILMIHMLDKKKMLEIEYPFIFDL